MAYTFRRSVLHFGGSDTLLPKRSTSGLFHRFPLYALKSNPILLAHRIAKYSKSNLPSFKINNGIENLMRLPKGTIDIALHVIESA